MSSALRPPSPRRGGHARQMAAAAARRRVSWLLGAAVFAANALLSGLRGDLWLAGLETATAVLAVLAAVAVSGAH